MSPSEMSLTLSSALSSLGGVVDFLAGCCESGGLWHPLVLLLSGCEVGFGGSGDPSLRRGGGDPRLRRGGRGDKACPRGGEPRLRRSRDLDRELRRNLYDDLESDLLGEREPLEHLLGEPLREPLLPRLGEPLNDPLDPLLGEPLKELLGGEILLLPPLCKLVLSCSSLLALPHPSLEPFLADGSRDRDLRGPFSREASLDLL